MGEDGYTRIPVQDEIAEELEEFKMSKETWSEALLRMKDAAEEDVTLDVTDVGPVELEATERRRVAEEVAEEIAGMQR